MLHIKHAHDQLFILLIHQNKIFSGRVTVNSQIGFKNSIQHISSEDATETIVCNQLGQENRFSSRNAVQRAPKTFVINQQGENCKIAITLVDQIKGKSSLNIEGKGIYINFHKVNFLIVKKKTTKLNSLKINYILKQM